MKASAAIIGSFAAYGVSANVLDRRTGVNGCNANNCLRGIRGSNGLPAQTSRLADCSSFMLTTVTPAVSTTTATVTITTTLLPPDKRREVEERQVTVIPGNVPAYATYCTGVAAYSSACSCAGVTGSTITAATPTSTVTATATATFTPAPVCPAGQASCGGGACIDTNSDPNNCGGCGITCGSGLTCGAGVCLSPASYACIGSATFASCGGGCDGNCFPDINSGQNYCKQSVACSTYKTTCTQDSDCPSLICITTGCGHVCANTANLCQTNAQRVKMLLEKKTVIGDIEARGQIMTDIGLIDA